MANLVLASACYALIPKGFLLGRGVVTTGIADKDRLRVTMPVRPDRGYSQMGRKFPLAHRTVLSYLEQSLQYLAVRDARPLRSTEGESPMANAGREPMKVRSFVKLHRTDLKPGA